MSVAIRGEKSFLRSNPSLSSVVASLEQITSALTNARDEWWKRSSIVSSQISPDDMKNPEPNRDTHQSMVSFRLPSVGVENSLCDVDREDPEFVDLQP
jgi:hypothetical protein